jgi:hypothetical protein
MWYFDFLGSLGMLVVYVSNDEVAEKDTVRTGGWVSLIGKVD